MGTNYYMITKNKELAEKYAPYSYTLTDTPDWGYLIHIAKTSCGWLPLFQGHRHGIVSVKQYKEAYDTNEFIIYDEYKTPYNWDEFTEKVLMFNGGKKGIEEPTMITSIDGKSYLTPFSHMAGTPQSYQTYDSKYRYDGIYMDEEGYEFDSRDFE